MQTQVKWSWHAGQAPACVIGLPCNGSTGPPSRKSCWPEGGAQMQWPTASLYSHLLVLYTGQTSRFSYPKEDGLSPPGYFQGTSKLSPTKEHPGPVQHPKTPQKDPYVTFYWGCSIRKDNFKRTLALLHVLQLRISNKKYPSTM